MKKFFHVLLSRRGDISNTFIINKVLSKSKELFKDELCIKIFTPQNFKIKHCIGCLNCFYHGTYSLDKLDDMRTLKNEILSSDIIIFGSLIYGTNVSGDTEVFFDRISC